MTTPTRQPDTTEQKQREAFCRKHGHHYITWLPGYKSITHKRCTYCGTPINGGSDK